VGHTQLYACGDRDRYIADPGGARPGQRTRDLPGFSPGRVSSSVSRCSELDFEQIVPASNSHPLSGGSRALGEGVSAILTDMNEECIMTRHRRSEDHRRESPAFGRVSTISYEQRWNYEQR